MILFVGKDYFDFFNGISDELSKEITAYDAEKIIITCDCAKAVEAVKMAKDKKIPVLAVADGYRAVTEAFGGTVEAVLECETGKQEWAVIDATSPVYVHLESVIQVCRAKPYAIAEKEMPSDLDCMSRAETGEIIALRNWSGPKQYGDIYALNYDIASALTPDGVQIVKNFLAL